MQGHKLTIESDGTEQGTKAMLDGQEISLKIGLIQFYHVAGELPFLRFVTHPQTKPPMPDLTTEEGRIVRVGDDKLQVEFGTRPSDRALFGLTDR